MDDPHIRLTDSMSTDLTQAMMLLEMMGDSPQFQDDHLRWAAHSLVQHVWQEHAGHSVMPLPQETRIILATISANVAIEDAKDKR